jgi:HTH-type transcriptional regulator/antitoxin HigA
MEIVSALATELQAHWEALQSLLCIRNEVEYDHAVDHLHQLLDVIGENEDHPLYGLFDTLGTVLHAYEEQYHPMPSCSGADVLRYLMEEHELTQTDLPEVGSQGVVSEVLRGKRELNVRQIRALADRFHVSPSVFF